MEEQKQIIEQVFKTAFDEFTPDVSPKVWSGISQQLAHPVAPSPHPSGSLVKMVGGKLGSVSSWIVGGIAATAITAGVLVYQNQNKETSNKELKTASEAATTVAQNRNDEKAAINSLAADHHGQTPETNSHAPVVKPHKNKVAVVDEFVSYKKQKLAEASKEESTHEEVGVTQPKNLPNDVDDTKEKGNTRAESQASANQGSNNNASENSVSPLILINSTAGFAPLQIACLLNKENMNGDWDFGDGITQLHANSATHKYIKPGTYILQCNTGESTITKTIEVIGQISTAFSPNADGINDYFYIDANNLNSFSLHIFDRNGRKIAELKNADEKWDGRMKNGDPAPPGTYFYELSAITENGKEISQRGAVNLFR